MTRDDFESWLADMDDVLECWLQTVDSAERARLDYSPESLSVVERLILEAFASSADALVPQASRRLDAFARYTGEVMRKNLGATWDIVLDRPAYAFVGLPILRHVSLRSEMCPHTLVTATADRRNGVFLRTAFDAASSSARAGQKVLEAAKGIGKSTIPDRE